MDLLKNVLVEGLNITQKVDGAPAVICCHAVEGYPDVCIALKSFTTSANNCYETEEAIDEKYGDRPDMAQKLKYCLDIAKYIPEGEAWQGDCLFSQDDLKETTIDGVKCITFQPNTIQYSAPLNSDTGAAISRADFGIAFHTIYRGSVGKLKQDFHVDVNRCKAPKNYYIMSVDLDKASTKPSEEALSKIKDLFENKYKPVADKLRNDPAYKDICENEAFMAFWNTFENANIADKRSITIKKDTFINDIMAYIDDKRTAAHTKKMAGLKTDKGKEKAQAKFEQDKVELDNLITTNRETLENMVEALNAAALIKMEMWYIMKNNKSNFNTHVNTISKGLVPVGMEGAALSDDEGNIVKIVDRTEFSANNRSSDIITPFSKQNTAKESVEDFFLNRLAENLYSTWQVIKEDDAEKGAPDAKVLRFMSNLDGVSCKANASTIAFDVSHHNAEAVTNIFNANDLSSRGFMLFMQPEYNDAKVEIATVVKGKYDLVQTGNSVVEPQSDGTRILTAANGNKQPIPATTSFGAKVAAQIAKVFGYTGPGKADNILKWAEDNKATLGFTIAPTVNKKMGVQTYVISDHTEEANGNKLVPITLADLINLPAYKNRQSGCYFYLAMPKAGKEGSSNPSDYDKVCIKAMIEKSASEKTAIAEGVTAAVFTYACFHTEMDADAHPEITKEHEAIASRVNHSNIATLTELAKRDDGWPIIEAYWNKEASGMDGWELEGIVKQTKLFFEATGLSYGNNKYACYRRSDANVTVVNDTVINGLDGGKFALQLEEAFAEAAGFAFASKTADMFNQADVVVSPVDDLVIEVPDLNLATKGSGNKVSFKMSQGKYVPQVGLNFVNGLTTKLNEATKSGSLYLISLKKCGGTPQLGTINFNGLDVKLNTPSKGALHTGEVKVKDTEVTFSINGTGKSVYIELPYTEGGTDEKTPYELEMTVGSADKVEMTGGPCTTARTGRLIGTLGIDGKGPISTAFMTAAAAAAKTVNIAFKDRDAVTSFLAKAESVIKEDEFEEPEELVYDGDFVEEDDYEDIETEPGTKDDTKYEPSSSEANPDQVEDLIMTVAANMQKGGAFTEAANAVSLKTDIIAKTAVIVRITASANEALKNFVREQVVPTISEVLVDSNANPSFLASLQASITLLGKVVQSMVMKKLTFTNLYQLAVRENFEDAVEGTPCLPAYYKLF